MYDLFVQHFLTIDRVLAIIGLVISILLTLYVYKIQKAAQKNSECLLKQMNTILEQQNKVTASIAIRYKYHINWFANHVGGILKSLKKNYEELYNRVEEYRIEKSDLNLRKMISISETMRIYELPAVISLVDRDIGIAKYYINNP